MDDDPELAAIRQRRMQQLRTSLSALDAMIEQIKAENVVQSHVTCRGDLNLNSRNQSNASANAKQC